MFFYASKLLFLPVVPSILLVMVAAVGAVLSLTQRWRGTGAKLSAAGIGMLLIAGFSPLGNILILPLEERFDRPNIGSDSQFAGILILGGFEDGRVSSGRGSMHINEAGERITEGLMLAKRLPTARVVFTGGVGALLVDSSPGAPSVGEFLRTAGVAEQRIVLESRSRTTWENAVLTREAVNPKPGERWLLVTSAFHMPRSMGVFRKAGFDVVAWPADYRTRDSRDAWRFFSRLSEGLERIDVATKEWIGLAAYRLTGRTDALWPGP